LELRAGAIHDVGRQLTRLPFWQVVPCPITKRKLSPQVLDIAEAAIAELACPQTHVIELNEPNYAIYSKRLVCGNRRVAVKDWI